MPFDTKRFNSTKFIRREDTIEVPDLKEFFGEGDKPVFIVRALEGEEVAVVREAVTKHKSISKIIEGIASTNEADRLQAVKDALGVIDSGRTPADLARRVEILRLGCVDPIIDATMAVKLFKAYPIDMYTVTDRILALTGLGSIPGKSKPSGVTQK